MDDWWETFRNNLKVAAKSVRYHYRLYLPFFAAIFVLQLFFGVLFFSADSASAIERQLVERDYDYHTVYRSLNEGQRMYLEKYAYRSDGNLTGLFEIVRTEQTPGFSTADRHYDIYLRYRGKKPQENCEKFENRYYSMLVYKSDNGTAPETWDTPLLKNAGDSGALLTVMTAMLAAVLGTVLLTVLYRVRIHNDRFEYGIYMALGADYRKLVENAVYEMLLVILIAFLPAIGSAYLIVSLIYGAAAPLPLSIVLSVLLLSVSIGLIACLLPMKLVSRSNPLAHILGADNSYYVSSPRLSFEMLGRSLKRHYGAFSLFRFRKYYIKILVTVTAFVVLAVGIFYFGTLMRQQQAMTEPQFVLHFGKGLHYDEDIAEELRAFEGISYVRKECVTEATDINSHLMLLEGQGEALSSLVHPQRYSRYFSYATDRVQYAACDEELIEYLSTFSYQGDLVSVLTDDYAVILSENMKNHKTLSVEPGDTIYAAVSVGINPDSVIHYDELMQMKGDELFKGYLEYYDYEYIPLTVAAVLTDYPSGANLPVFLSLEGYHNVTSPYDVYGEVTVGFDTVEIFVDSSLNAEAITRLEYRLSRWAQEYGNIALANRQTYGQKQIEAAWRLPWLLFVAAFMIALLIPVIVFFSQIVFYRKRYSEMDTLLLLGATEREIALLYRWDAVMLAILAASLSAAGSCLGIRGLYTFMQIYGGSRIYFSYEFPLAVWVAAIPLVALTVYVSVMLSYRLYRTACRKRITDSVGISKKGGREHADSGS